MTVDKKNEFVDFNYKTMSLTPTQGYSTVHIVRSIGNKLRDYNDFSDFTV